MLPFYILYLVVNLNNTNVEWFQDFHFLLPVMLLFPQWPSCYYSHLLLHILHFPLYPDEILEKIKEAGFIVAMQKTLNLDREQVLYTIVIAIDNINISIIIAMDNINISIIIAIDIIHHSNLTFTIQLNPISPFNL